jgi:hypothetical protein
MKKQREKEIVLLVIENALHHKGVVITAGLPEHVLEELYTYGYKIKKRKKAKRKG